MSTRKTNAKPKYTLALNCAVYLKSQTDKSKQGILKKITENRKYAWVLWRGATEWSLHATSNLCVPEEWEDIRDRQANLAAFWQGGAR